MALHLFFTSIFTLKRFGIISACKVRDWTWDTVALSEQCVKTNQPFGISKRASFQLKNLLGEINRNFEIRAFLGISHKLKSKLGATISWVGEDGTWDTSKYPRWDGLGKIYSSHIVANANTRGSKMPIRTNHISSCHKIEIYADWIEISSDSFWIPSEWNKMKWSSPELCVLSICNATRQ